jgi:hypothetical protein
MKPYKIINNEMVALVEGPFAGIEYQYSRVQLLEEKDALRLKYEYTIIDGEPSDIKAFEQYIGGILHEMIEEKLTDNSIVYTGGVDEN